MDGAVKGMEEQGQRWESSEKLPVSRPERDGAAEGGGGMADAEGSKAKSVQTGEQTRRGGAGRKKRWLPSDLGPWENIKVICQGKKHSKKIQCSW